jgi:hypothetical protein
MTDIEINLTLETTLYLLDRGIRTPPTILPKRHHRTKTPTTTVKNSIPMNHPNGNDNLQLILVKSSLLKGVTWVVNSKVMVIMMDINPITG